VTYTECPDVTGRWGQLCPTCGKQLPSFDRTAYFEARDAVRSRRSYLYHDAKPKPPRCGLLTKRGPCVRVLGHLLYGEGHRAGPPREE